MQKFALASGVVAITVNITGRHSKLCFEMVYTTYLQIVFGFDFCLTVHHQLGKVIQMNQLDATVTIYCSIRSAQHVSGNLLPIIRSVSLRFLQHMVSCCCGGQGDGERQRGTWCHATAHRLPAPPQQQDTICCKKSQSHAPDDGQKIARNMLS